VTEAFSVVPASLSLPLPPLSIQRRKSLLGGRGRGREKTEEEPKKRRRRAVSNGSET